MRQPGICVLINSCDKYSDLWDPFFHFFEKYWPDCPYPVFLASNTKLYSRKNVRLICSGINGTWSEETLAVLNNIPCEYLIYLQDDYLLTKKTDGKTIQDLFEKMKEYKADYLRLFPSPGPDAEYRGDKEIGLIGKNTPYRTSLQCAIWKTEVFAVLLNKEENQWDFEINSPGRAGNYLFLSIKQAMGSHLKHHTYPLTYFYLTAVVRGKWRRDAAKLCRQEGLILNEDLRKIESVGEKLRTAIYDASPLIIKKMMDYFRYRILKK